MSSNEFSTISDTFAGTPTYVFPSDATSTAPFTTLTEPTNTISTTVYVTFSDPNTATSEVSTTPTLDVSSTPTTSITLAISESYHTPHLGDPPSYWTGPSSSTHRKTSPPFNSFTGSIPANTLPAWTRNSDGGHRASIVCPIILGFLAFLVIAFGVLYCCIRRSRQRRRKRLHDAAVEMGRYNALGPQAIVSPQEMPARKPVPASAPADAGSNVGLVQSGDGEDVHVPSEVSSMRTNEEMEHSHGPGLVTGDGHRVTFS